MVFGLSSRSRSAPSWANVESLCAYELDSRRRYARIEPNDIRLNILAASVSTALDLLGSHRGRIALAELAEDTFLNTEEVNYRRESPPACAQGFLRSIISTLPVIIVNDLGDINARTSRERWNQPPGRSFVGQQAALVEVNSRLLDQAISARKSFDRSKTEDARVQATTFVFRLGVTIAHELCHVFTVYLLFDPRAMTPPEVTFGAAYTNDRYGEAGRYWEAILFGGHMDMRGEYDSKSRTTAWQVAVKDAAGRNAYIIRGNAILKIMDRDFNILPFIEGGGFEAELISKKDGLTWRRYRDLFKGCSKEPPKLPNELRAIFTTPRPETAKRYFITGSNICDWMSRPGSNLPARHSPVLNL